MKPLQRELTVVGFAGGGGSCEGIRMATGNSPDIALNHDSVAVGMHKANHPDTLHYCQNIWKAVPSDVLRTAKKAGLATKIGLGWFSPDCKHFSKAKGGKPVDKNVRDLAWVIIGWAKLPRNQRPRIIIVENVEEFVTWGPLGADGRPCVERGGEYFRKWIREFKRLGYKVDWREIVAANKGAPTIRKRLFVIARNDGAPIVWPDDTHAKPASPYVISGVRAPWRTAAEIIDWSLPCPSIFDTSKQIKAKYGVRAIRPLADNTLARVARGVFRYVIDCADPFIVPITHTGDERVHSLAEPMRTVTTAHRGEHALIAPMLVNTRNGERIGQEPRCRGTGEPWTTVTSIGSQGAVVAAFLAQHNTDMVGHDAREPVSTIVQKGCTQAVVSAGLINLKGSDRRQSRVRDPAPTQCAGGWHIAEVRAFIMKYHRDGGQAQSCADPLAVGGTKGRFGVVTVAIAGETYALVDIGMRMLTPRELFRAQGFSDGYIIDRQFDGTPITKTDQIRMCGNSVCPQVAQALVGANYEPALVSDRGVPAFEFEVAA